jgi:hypothetical protein
MNLFKSANYIVINDIDASITTTWNSGQGFIPVGYWMNEFTGTLDGQNYIISNLYINNSNNDTGLFGIIYYTEIANIILENVDFTTSQFSGGLVGVNNNSTINNCHTSGSIISDEVSVGGLVGYNDSGIINNSHSACNTSGGYRVGGLVGNNNGNITNSYSEGNVSTTRGPAGGFTGFVLGGNILNCYSLGNTTTLINSISGGFIGQVFLDMDSVIITNCYSKGIVTGDSLVGGFIGGKVDLGGPEVITNCYWDIETSGQATSEGGTGKTTAEMNTQATFLNWDFATPVWEIHSALNSGYPYLEWQGLVPPFAGGDGTVGDPYQISNAVELQNMNLVLSANYIIVNDIDASITTTWNSGAGFIPVGDDTNKFTGTLDGQNYTIFNVYINNITHYNGLFGAIDHTEVSNIILANVDITTSSFSGGLVGFNNYSTINNCHTTGDITANGSAIGGLVGENRFGEINNSHSSCNTSGEYEVGGLVGVINGNISNSYSEGNVESTLWGIVGGFAGRIYSGDISTCYSLGDVTSFDGSAGGFIGNFDAVDGEINIINCYSEGNIIATDGIVGGFIGQSWVDMGSVTITNSFSTGFVDGVSGTGGFIGNSMSMMGTIDITNCYWDIETSGQATSDGGTGKTTAEMNTQSTFTNWDFTTPIWIIHSALNSGYPYLEWQGLIPPFAGGDGTVGDPYQISNVDELQNMNLYLSANYIVVNDIDASITTTWNSGEGFIPIGYWLNEFTGTLDGQDYTISNLYINNSNNDTGLFGIIKDTEVANIILENVDYTTSDYSGGLTGVNNNSTITNCHTSGSITSDGYTVGGLVGFNDNGSIYNSHSEGNTSGGSKIGGLVGDNSGNIDNSHSACITSGESHVGGLVGSSLGNINNSYSEGDVVSSIDYGEVGGFAGYVFAGNISNCYSIGDATSLNGNCGGFIGFIDAMMETVTITNCYSLGDASTSGGVVGGFIGNCMSFSMEPITITNCFSTGFMTGISSTGGFIGEDMSMEPSLITSCYWDVETSGQATSVGGTGKTTAEMMVQANYVSWDFTTPIWNIHSALNSGYPYLEWQGLIQPLSAPQNVVAEVVGLDFNLTWDAVSGATGYKVYASIDPNGTYADISLDGVFGEESWSYEYIDNKMFYYVVAVDGGKLPVTKKNVIRNNSKVR